MSDVKAEECDMANPSLTQKVNDPQEFSASSPDDQSKNVCEGENKGEDSIDPVPQKGRQYAAIEGELDFEIEPGNAEVSRKKKEQMSVSNEASKEEKHKKNQIIQATSEKTKEIKTNNALAEDVKDDGECSDDEDLEEGEVKDPDDQPVTKEKPRQVCRFFNRGVCFYGLQCRFLHLNKDNKGNYNMFAPSPPKNYESTHVANVISPPGQHAIVHRSATHRAAPDFVPIPPPIPILPEPESAWEKGLREAKELVKRANKRKEDPDFEEKRLNLKISAEVTEKEKENDGVKNFTFKKKKREEADVVRYEPTYSEPPYYESRPQFIGRYENYEIRYTRADRGADRGGRPRMNRKPYDDRGARFNQRSEMANWRNDRMENLSKARGESFFDPWRRSKSPKRLSRERERSRSVCSYSSVSSFTSKSSCSSHSSPYSSSHGGSRSPTEKKNNPPISDLFPSDGPNQFNTNMPGGRTRSSRSRSLSRGRSLYSSLSHSSRSISMDSVSSATSCLSQSSITSLDRAADPSSIPKKQDEKLDNSVGPPATTYFQPPRPIKMSNPNVYFQTKIRDPLEEEFQRSQADPPFQPPPSILHLLPSEDKERERPKELSRSMHPPKQQIKLTLLNKNPQPKFINVPKAEDVNMMKQTDDAVKVTGFQIGMKRPPSPPPIIAPPPPPPPVVQKKSASSRRDELLKQLRAVEDAIARKRAKFD
ncbi:zinc finger CCCH domain-containing protein 18 [Caerostris darwini]|uniref:Zinc finger CCCH domain-containing protein 18 n=1 Tax=Caerostris darwini TaxID=1538125 RepID=A0AAV4T1S9_9ARAC|nr:zinc finger CCCH domain-containing protein 18 [Caerostris darwini]